MTNWSSEELAIVIRRESIAWGLGRAEVAEIATLLQGLAEVDRLAMAVSRLVEFPLHS